MIKIKSNCSHQTLKDQEKNHSVWIRKAFNINDKKRNKHME